MENTSLLVNKHSVSSQSEIVPLEQQEICKLLIQLKGGWKINNFGHLYKSYEFKDFMSAMEFANKIAIIAEQKTHHPNLTISYGMCAIEIWTHKIGGLTQSDFMLANKIEAIL
jgi:4a-hydroxytetrahydrobiopterin dehydratase